MHTPSESAPPIEPAHLSDLIAAGNVFVLDVRRHAGSEQIFGAIRYNPRHLLDAGRLLLPLPKSGDTPIVLYDDTGDGPDLAPLAAKFHQNGYTVRLLRGGFTGWRAAARRTEELSLEQPIPVVEEQQLEG